MKRAILLLLLVATLGVTVFAEVVVAQTFNGSNNVYVVRRPFRRQLQYLPSQAVYVAPAPVAPAPAPFIAPAPVAPAPAPFIAPAPVAPAVVPVVPH